MQNPNYIFQRLIKSSLDSDIRHDNKLNNAFLNEWSNEDM